MGFLFIFLMAKLLLSPIQVANEHIQLFRVPLKPNKVIIQFLFITQCFQPDGAKVYQRNMNCNASIMRHLTAYL